MTTGQQDQTGMGLIFGTYEDALKMIGTSSEVLFAEAEINWPMIKYYCSLTEDANPSYWDKEFAEYQWGGIIAPPGMLLGWMMPLKWRPDGARPSPLFASKVPLPGSTLINVSTESEFYRPIKEGDQINMIDKIVDVSYEKETRLGVGHFIITDAIFRNQRGEHVAKNTNIMFRYNIREEDQACNNCE